MEGGGAQARAQVAPALLELAFGERCRQRSCIVGISVSFRARDADDAARDPCRGLPAHATTLPRGKIPCGTATIGGRTYRVIARGMRVRVRQGFSARGERVPVEARATAEIAPDLNVPLGMPASGSGGR